MSISKEKILDTAAQLFQEFGYNVTTIQDITDRLGVTKGSFYYYIKSKEALLCEIFDRAMTTVERKVEEVVKVKLPIAEKLELLITTHILAQIEESAIISVFYNELKRLPSDYQSKIIARRRQYEDKFVHILREGVVSGDLVSVDGLPIVYGILGMCNWIYQWYKPDGRLKPTELAKLFSGLILKGLLPR